MLNIFSPAKVDALQELFINNLLGRIIMPQYEYKCHKCGRKFDARQRITDDPLTRCPLPDINDTKKVCLGEVRRVIAPVPVIFNTVMN